MTNINDCNTIDKYWKDNFYFCEEKIISTMAQFYNRNHELMFCGTMNFSYKRNAEKQNECIGRRICVKYVDERKFLKKFHGIYTHCMDKKDSSYSANAVYELCKEKVILGIPVAIGLDNSLFIWDVKAGEEEVEVLPFLVVGINEDDSMNLVDFHESAMVFTISKETFLQSYHWYTSFSAKEEAKNIDLRELLEEICEIQKLQVPSNMDCYQVFSNYPNLSKAEESSPYDSNHDSCKEMMDLAEDILDMELESEVCGRKSVIFVPFYFDLLVLYRSRFVFAKALTYLNKQFGFHLFDSIIYKSLVSSSKWNYIRILFSDSYHANNLDRETKKEISEIIKKIAEYEREIKNELIDLLKKCESDLFIYASKDKNSKSERLISMKRFPQRYLVDLSNHYNHRLFHKMLTGKDGNRFLEGRYYYNGIVPFGTIYHDENDCFLYPSNNILGDSIVCAGQEVEIHKGFYSSITVIGSALYNEMVYDYVTINYADSTKEQICLGFNGWNDNGYEIDTFRKKIVWQGYVKRREGGSQPDKIRKARIYSKQYKILSESEVVSITFPINSFLSIIAITFDKRGI